LLKKIIDKKLLAEALDQISSNIDDMCDILDITQKLMKPVLELFKVEESQKQVVDSKEFKKQPYSRYNRKQ